MVCRSHAHTVLVLAASTLLSGCLIRSDSHVEHRGQHVGPQTLEQIEPGRRKDYVLALLGEPSRRAKLEEDIEIWSWSYTQVKRSNAGVIFVLRSKRSTQERGAVYVEFENDVVTRTWRD